MSQGKWLDCNVISRGENFPLRNVRKHLFNFPQLNLSCEDVGKKVRNLSYFVSRRIEANKHCELYHKKKKTALSDRIGLSIEAEGVAKRLSEGLFTW